MAVEKEEFKSKSRLTVTLELNEPATFAVMRSLDRDIKSGQHNHVIEEIYASLAYQMQHIENEDE